jgi:hypothetical protein
MGLNAENKKQVDKWNENNSKECLVRHYIDGNEDDYEIVETKSKAYLTYLPYPVIKLSGHVKLVNLNHVKPIEVRK